MLIAFRFWFNSLVITPLRHGLPLYTIVYWVFFSFFFFFFILDGTAASSHPKIQSLPNGIRSVAADNKVVSACQVERYKTDLHAEMADDHKRQKINNNHSQADSSIEGIDSISSVISVQLSEIIWKEFHSLPSNWSYKNLFIPNLVSLCLHSKWVDFKGKRQSFFLFFAEHIFELFSASPRNK